MATAYPNYSNVPIDDEQPQSNNVYINPYYHDREQISDEMDPRGQYVSDSNTDVNSYSTDHYSPHHHHHHHEQRSRHLLPLAIRRHQHGSTDPSLQKIPTHLQASPSDNLTSPSNSISLPPNNISSSSKLHVTIKRNSKSPDQPIIQPILYPVAVYINSPAPQYPNNQPIQPIKEITKPPSPKKPISPIKTSPIPPSSSDRYETESFQPPPSRNKPPSTRRPIRTDLITPTPPILEPRKVRSGKAVVEEFDVYDEYYRVPSIYTVPEKVISYRTAPGMTTRELENARIDHSEEVVYIESPQAETVTYRVS